MSELRWWTLLLLNLLPIVIASCSVSGMEPTEQVFTPPTLAATLVPQAPPTPIRLPPSPTPHCIDDLRFLRDITIPDGSIVSRGKQLDKRWLVENSGTCNWDDRYSLELITGSELGVPATQALYPARSGSQVTFRILYSAPKNPGIYHSAWQAHDPQGEPFGDPVFIEIIVQ